MHCLACDCELSDAEAVRKDKQGGFIDLCNTCYQFTRDELTYIEIENELKGIFNADE